MFLVGLPLGENKEVKRRDDTLKHYLATVVKGIIGTVYIFVEPLFLRSDSSKGKLFYNSVKQWKTIK